MRAVQNHGHEHELEPQYGLPEELPGNERVLWQGSPDWRSLAVRAFHVRKVAIYFLLIVGLRVGLMVDDGAGAGEIAADLGRLLPLPLAALAMLAALAWLSARTTVYTITDRRVVMRIGIVLTLTFNLPLRLLHNADLHAAPDGTADIALQLPPGDRIAWLHLWPHARAWHVRHPQPMLRSVPDGRAVAAILGGAWSAATGLALAGERREASPAVPTGSPDGALAT
ncbi:MAG: photosynthetic complex putative assembly protein PuhB [Pseudomonadota bacterium]|jgi:hypothetical protein